MVPHGKGLAAVMAARASGCSSGPCSRPKVPEGLFHLQQRQGRENLQPRFPEHESATCQLPFHQNHTQQKRDNPLKGTQAPLGRVTRAGRKAHEHPPQDEEPKNTEVGDAKTPCPLAQHLMNFKKVYMLKQLFETSWSRKHCFQCDFMGFAERNIYIVVS